MVCIGKEIISFQWPCFVGLVEGIDIARRGGVEHLHLIRLRTIMGREQRAGDEWEVLSKNS